ncbi:4-aminobutyrate aminotransferase (EC 2.6.1.19) [Mycetohabitans rhizoxinica HKI 454]|uniref:4-aminobutyrate aminotransferase n=1 Tax=Mycetohabitans rhizoxinica (strain DSM 19002 / CIP 109453 / HKI 454) TaxID=882378 RepID=E5APX9_MYCRK|nr:4-aminobutyrate aminotransferase (EC 2.6.1.19) [Mycetohabitans rhizoxinica HKI 454]
MLLTLLFVTQTVLDHTTTRPHDRTTSASRRRAIAVGAQVGSHAPAIVIRGGVAIRRQLDKGLMHTAYQVVPYASYVREDQRIGRENQRFGTDQRPEKSAFFTTGAEAVENAVKIARLAQAMRRA